MNGATENNAYWPAPGRGVLVDAPGSTTFLHQDWLGNDRIASAIDGHTVRADRAYAPYGEQYNTYGTTNPVYGIFAQITGDYDSGVLFDTPNREYAFSQGRWLSPDPAGFGWNQYAYVTNPNSVIDPSGLRYCWLNNRGGDGGCVGVGGNGGGDPADFGNTIFDALMGEPGTYLIENLYGQLSFGFSSDLWSLTLNIIDAEAAGWNNVAQFQGIPLGILNTQVSLSSSGWVTYIEDLGGYSAESGILPDLVSMAQLAAGDEKINQAIVNGVNPALAGYILDSTDSTFQSFEAQMENVISEMAPLVMGISYTFTPFEDVPAPTVIIPPSPMPNIPPAPAQIPAPPSI